MVIGAREAILKEAMTRLGLNEIEKVRKCKQSGGLGTRRWPACIVKLAWQRAGVRGGMGNLDRVKERSQLGHGAYALRLNGTHPKTQAKACAKRVRPARGMTGGTDDMTA